MKFIKYLFSPNQKYENVRPIQVYVMRLFYTLMFVFVAKDAWAELLTHTGEWNPEIAISWSAMAAYTTLSGLGIIHPLRMLPIMLFMLLYKGTWLLIVAYPMWKSGTITGTDVEGWAQIFILIVLPAIFLPWKYVLRNFVLLKRASSATQN